MWNVDNHFPGSGSGAQDSQGSGGGGPVSCVYKMQTFKLGRASSRIAKWINGELLKHDCYDSQNGLLWTTEHNTQLQTQLFIQIINI